ncbi:hypothetical protein KF913_01570 [Candidatus Obscuribacterales bacterium]|nr:hypothetical protein [Candidatus Obscuribacterales bacterium]
MTRLDISDSNITDESLRELIKMPTLAILQVSNCKQLSDMALNEFRKARPSCEVQTFVRMKAKDMDLSCRRVPKEGIEPTRGVSLG